MAPPANFSEPDFNQNGENSCDENCLVHRVSALPLVKGTIEQASTGYQMAKEYGPRTKQTLSMVENTLGFLSGKAEPYYDYYLYDYAMRLSALGCRGLDAIEAKYPSAIKVTPAELKEIGQQYYQDSYVKMATDNVVQKKVAAGEMLHSYVTSTRMLAQSQLAKMSHSLLSSVDYCDELVDRYLSIEDGQNEGQCGHGENGVMDCGCVVEEGAPVSQRLWHMSHKAKCGLAARASKQRTALNQLANDYVQQMMGVLVLVDYARERMASAKDTFGDKFRAVAQRVDQAAKKYAVSPEHILLSWLQTCSSALLTGSESLQKFVDNGKTGQVEMNAEMNINVEVNGEPAGSSSIHKLLTTSVAYVQALDSTCHEANSLNDLRVSMMDGAGSMLGGMEKVLVNLLDDYKENRLVQWMGVSNSRRNSGPEIIPASQKSSVSSESEQNSADVPKVLGHAARFISCDSDATEQENF